MRDSTQANARHLSRVLVEGRAAAGAARAQRRAAAAGDWLKFKLIQIECRMDRGIAWHDWHAAIKSRATRARASWHACPPRGKVS